MTTTRDAARDVISQVRIDIDVHDGLRGRYKLEKADVAAILDALAAAGIHMMRWQDISEAPKDGTAVLMTNHGPGMNVRIGFHVPLERRRRDEPIDEAWWAQREEIDEHHRCGMRPSVFAPLPPAPQEDGP